MREQIIKQGITLLFLLAVLAIMWFAYPRLMMAVGEGQSRGFWKAEDAANKRRLFGGDSSDVTV